MAGTINIDWDDGTTDSFAVADTTGSTTLAALATAAGHADRLRHDYTSIGVFTIAVTVTSGGFITYSVSSSVTITVLTDFPLALTARERASGYLFVDN